MTAPEYMSTEDLAELLSVPVATVRFWRSNGSGPAGFRVGRGVRYRRTDVDAWIHEREQLEREQRTEVASS